MTHQIHIPIDDRANFLDASIETGETLFVVGANGTGKSSLIQRLYSLHHGHARRISAHRQTWFTSNAITLSPHDKRTTEVNINNTDTNPTSRWRDDYSAARASIAIYDLIDAENIRAREIAKSVDANELDRARELARRPAPLLTINELLRESNLPIKISVHESEQVMASKDGCQPYSISELSDGERNALLIAADVLTVKPGTIVFVDEPERHLHRSIVSPLLTHLFGLRTDCSFVISTHDVSLPLAAPTAKILLVRKCHYNGSHAAWWDADLINDGAIDEDIKIDVLGARRRVLFVEGTNNSLDRPLYSLLFPELSIVAKSSCQDVERAVRGIRESEALHWVKAFGIVDNDRRSPEVLGDLRTTGVHALPVYAVESIYYHPEIQKRVADRQSAVLGEPAGTMLEAARAAALRVIGQQELRFCQRAIQGRLRHELMQRLPKQEDIANTKSVDISINIEEALNEEQVRFKAALAANDLIALISQYPVRESSALAEIASRLGFQGRAKYEAAVRKMISDEPSALTFLRGLFGDLAQELLQ